MNRTGHSIRHALPASKKSRSRGDMKSRCGSLPPLEAESTDLTGDSSAPGGMRRMFRSTVGQAASLRHDAVAQGYAGNRVAGQAVPLCSCTTWALKALKALE